MASDILLCLLYMHVPVLCAVGCMDVKLLPSQSPLVTGHEMIEGEAACQLIPQHHE
jgi:hypothetical protein